MMGVLYLYVLVLGFSGMKTKSGARLVYKTVETHVMLGYNVEFPLTVIIPPIPFPSACISATDVSCIQHYHTTGYN